MTFQSYLNFLGTGTSTGVPQIGCQCPVCTSHNPKNKRLRSSVTLKVGDYVLLIDSSMDLRQQALKYHLTQVDAVLYTHGHVDHVGGFDDLRAFCWGKPDGLPLYGSNETLKILERMYPWAFAENVYPGYVRPITHTISRNFVLGPIVVTSVPVIHGNVETHGFVFDVNGYRIAYVPDVKTVPAGSMSLLENVDVMIMDGLRYHEHTTHMHVDDAVALIESVGAKKAYLTHLSHHIDYHELKGRLPKHIEPAYDGLKIPIRQF